GRGERSARFRSGVAAARHGGERAHEHGTNESGGDGTHCKSSFRSRWLLDRSSAQKEPPDQEINSNKRYQAGSRQFGRRRLPLSPYIRSHAVKKLDKTTGRRSSFLLSCCRLPGSCCPVSLPCHVASS